MLAPARSRVFSFLRDGGGDFFFINALPSIHTRGLLCLPVPRLRLRWDKCVASPCSDIDTGLLFIFRPTPSRLLFQICLLRLVPPSAPGRGRRWLLPICGCGHGCGLPASPSCRSALSLPLVRYYDTVHPAWRVAWLSCRFRDVITRRASPLRSMWLKRFNRCGFLSNHPSVACDDVMSFNPIGFILSLLARPVIFLVCLFLACGRMMRCRVLHSACLVGRRPAHASRSPVPPSCPTDGEGMA